METRYMELAELIAKLKRNRDNVPLETLRTKYKKAYQELLDDIRHAAEETVRAEALSGIQIRKGDEEIIQRIQDAYTKGRYGKQLGEALTKDYSVDKFGEIVDNYRREVLAIWMPYWQGFCCIYATEENFTEPYPEPKVYNELTDEFLTDPEKNIWEKKPEWKSEKRTIITAGACKIIAQALREKEEKEHGQTGKHQTV